MQHRIPMNDLGRLLRAQSDDLTKVFADVLESGWLVHGPRHASFEAELAHSLDVRHALGVGNGTDALELGLRALAHPGRDVVVTVANAGGYASVAASRAGHHRLRFCDVDPLTHLIDVAALEAVMDEQVATVVVTHLFGRMADVRAVREVAHRHGAKVLEDCAQAMGATDPEGAAAGSIGDAGCFSFYPTKNLGALGDGGAVVTSDPTIAERLTGLRQYGWDAKYRIGSPGGRNSRLDELQAALLLYRLPLVAGGNARRRAIITTYAECATGVVRVLPAAGPAHAGHLAVVETRARDRLRSELDDAGIDTDVHYPIPDHHQVGLAGAVDAPTSLPVTEMLARRIVSLPCFPELTDSEVERICRVLERF